MKLVDLEGHEFTYDVRLDFKSMNNEGEYKAFMAGLRIAKKLGARHPEAHVDSMLVANQIGGTYETKEDKMASYHTQAKALMLNFATCKVIHIKRSENKQADALTKLASVSFEHLGKDIRVEFIDNPSVPAKEVCVVSTGTTNWMTPIINFLSSGALPEQQGGSQIDTP
ncbi:uncharacterized protein LOC143590066 [Bidens hawaiensis]|uniref:uncharacterized protein LOC143590066 n=1 Tax=Bidens hawaiensis TaxID=980011 RepID=UPI0040499143